VLINNAIINKKARSTGRTNQPGHWKYMPLLRQMTDPCLLDTEEDNPWGKYSEILRSLLITSWRDARDQSAAKLNALYNMRNNLGQFHLLKIATRPAKLWRKETRLEKSLQGYISRFKHLRQHL
jgi:hypothetical protein